MTPQKWHVQNSNNVQTELHTIFEATKQELEAIKQELEAAKIKLSDAASVWWQEKIARKFIANDLAISENALGSLQKESKADKASISNLKRRLRRENERANANSDAKATLEQPKSQWSTLFNILSENPLAPPSSKPNPLAEEQ